jgi:hypothetical protein
MNANGRELVSGELKFAIWLGNDVNYSHGWSL